MSDTQCELLDVSAVEEGYGALTLRAAAKRAGIHGEDNAVDVAASKLVRRAKVQAIIARAWARSLREPHAASGGRTGDAGL